MPQSSRLASQTWQILSETCSDTIRDAVARIIQRDKADLAAAFYTYMLQDEGAKPFLSVTTVEARLKPGLQRWLEVLFQHRSVEELAAALALQRHVGEVHARAQIPVNLVARGLRLLKHEINTRLLDTPLDRTELVNAVLYVDRLTDVAFEEMSAAFMLSSERGVRTDEAYRMFAAGRDLALEREKQSVAVLEWEARFYRMLAAGSSFDDIPSLKDSEFGLWLYHKAPLLFDETRELPLIGECVERIDQSLFPQLVFGRDKDLHSDTNRALAKAVLVEVDQIKFLLRSMFDRLVDLDVGRDVLTQLFNRRFLPSILKREISLSRRSDSQFCVLMLDIDHFKRVNDEHGHDAGDRVLQHVAGQLMNQVRGGDFVFRYGGEEFLVVLAAIDEEQARNVADKIRQRIAEMEVPLAASQNLRVTISIGIAVNDGHPDYQRIIERADRALYAAKETGRNRVVAA
ncbi:GGDEF domain-containing protein [Zoogloea sp.]|uniref:GGDEF domain-containing protein n=1 Tax=Zoogloea sp. TaxID=49181 RepID=UPI0025CFCAF3|nr:GGDEF domain-containing protein [Zoogloea sp.]MCK6395648.1 GGDEF domain-containing protein [Zoogloea sp.]